MERVKGIEPSSQAWEAHILPLNHTRTGRTDKKNIFAEDSGRNGGIVALELTRVSGATGDIQFCRKGPS